MGYDILNIYINLYKININDDVIYDIVYATGGGGIKWCPYDKNLGGSEQAIVHLANEWSNNKNIYVYGNFSEELDIKADDSTYLKHYKFWYNYPFSAKVKNLIIWRKSGLYLLLKFNINADNIILDLHDNFSYTLQSMNNTDLIFCFNKITHFNFKSNYHKECFETFLQTKNIILENKKYNVIPNGIRLDEFKVANNYIRQPYRFCYCSSYDRGIANIITNIWKKIYEKQPKSELHVYYGMDYIYDNTFKINMQYLLGEKGVMDHGRQTVEYIIEEKYKSTFHIYLTDTDAEIDCINIKESLVSGCIPLLIDINVFKERDGIKFNNLAETDAIISKILSLMDNNNNELEIIRDKLKQSKTIVDWKTTSAAWNTIFLQ